MNSLATNDTQAFLGELYAFLIDQMHVTLNEYVKEEKEEEEEGGEII